MPSILLAPAQFDERAAQVIPVICSVVSLVLINTPSPHAGICFVEKMPHIIMLSTICFTLTAAYSTSYP